MSKPKWLESIEYMARGMPVLLVEGNTDISILTYFLRQISPQWNTNIVMLSASRKSQVIKAIKTYYPTKWAGIVDRDEWAPKQVEKELAKIPRVQVLPRFCLENYFCDPDELWIALPSVQKQTIANDLNRFKEPILLQLDAWLAHGAMWRVIRNRRQGLLSESGFPKRLEGKPVLDETEIRNILKEWHTHLDPDQIIAEYYQELKKAQSLSVDKQLKVYIHGKRFFRQVIVQNLNKLFGQASPDVWLERFTQDTHGLKIPLDLEKFLQAILNLFLE